jgi:hypothetical protein
MGPAEFGSGAMPPLHAREVGTNVVPMQARCAHFRGHAPPVAVVPDAGPRV